MKQLGVVVVLAIFATLLLLPERAMAGEAAANELILLNWGEYFDPELLQVFEKRHQVKIKEVHFETDETRDEVLAQTNAEKHDLVLVSSHKVEGYVRRGWLAPIPGERIANLRHVEKRWRNTHPQAADYAVPVFWGTLGIGYRSDLVTEKITSWKQLFTPREVWRKKILMIKDSGDLYGMALKSLGYSINSTDSDAIAAAEKLLMEQKPFVKNYGYLTLNKDSGLVTGRYHLAMLYNGDAISLRKIKPEIRYVVPEEGTNLWLDSLVVLAKSKRQELAWAFLDFIHEPEIAARMALFANYASVNGAAAQHLPKEHLANPTIYPPAEVLERSEFSQSLPPKVMRKVNSGFNRLIH